MSRISSLKNPSGVIIIALFPPNSNNDLPNLLATSLPTILPILVDPIERYGKQEAKIGRIKNPSKNKIIELGEKIIESKYGNLFQMYEKIVAVELPIE